MCGGGGGDFCCVAELVDLVCDVSIVDVEVALGGVDVLVSEEVLHVSEGDVAAVWEGAVEPVGGG